MRLKSVEQRLKAVDTRLGVPIPAPCAAQRLRGRALQERNLRILRRDPLCVRCLAMKPSIITVAVEVDHIIALHKGGHDGDQNLQGLCIPCHRIKSAAEATAASRANGGGYR